MIQHVDKYPIYSIFDRDAKFYYFIPKYQRAYTWSYSEWGNLNAPGAPLTIRRLTCP